MKKDYSKPELVEYEELKDLTGGIPQNDLTVDPILEPADPAGQ